MKARRIVLWMFLGVIAAFGLYTVKYRVQALKIEVAAAERQLREEKKSLHVLTAEWAYLNRPERLRTLSAKYLGIKPVEGKQLSDLASLPVSGTALAAEVQKRTPLSPGLTLASGNVHGQ